MSKFQNNVHFVYWNDPRGALSIPKNRCTKYN